MTLHLSRLLPTLAAVAILTTSATPHTGDDPIPVASVPFAIPLSDGTTTSAVILPAPENSAYLVFATAPNRLQVWRLTPPTDPVTPPDPAPAAPRLIVTVTETIPAEIPTAIAAYIASTGSQYRAFTVAMVAQRDPPQSSLSWIGKTAGKKYPYTFVATDAGRILWRGSTPTTDAEWQEALTKAQPSRNSVPQLDTCPCRPQ